MSYRDYRKGKLDAYVEALRIIHELDETEVYKPEDALKRIQERLEHHIQWNVEELERLEKQQ